MKIIEKYPDYFTASHIPELVTIDSANYVSILGKGSPGTDIFYEKKTAIKDFVAKLQGHFTATSKAFENAIIEFFYWFDKKDGFVNIGDFYTTLPLALLNYRIAIRIPNEISEEDIKTVSSQNSDLSFSKEFERFSYTAGECVQLMHSGPFADELETLPILQKFADDNGLVNEGLHHEIHLTNFEKGQSQEHLKTILRDAVLTIKD